MHRAELSNELFHRLVRDCSVQDATLEGPFAADDNVVNNVHTLTNYVSKCAEKFAAHGKSVAEQ